MGAQASRRHPHGAGEPPESNVGPLRHSMLLALFFCSGSAALIYQVLWLKELGLLFGVTAYAAATTLAVFFLGLATGSFACGQRAASLPNPLRTYGWLEIGIAASAGLYFFILDAYHWLYPRIFAALGHQPALLLLVKFALALGILLPPAFFMGGTLPVMGQFLVRGADRFGRTTTALYAVNTLGAATGALLAGFYLPARFGFRVSYLIAIGLNLLIAALAFWWSRAEARAVTVEASSEPAARREPVPVATSAGELEHGLLWTTAVASGLLTLALEVLWTRMFAQVLQNSVYTFAAILTVFLVALGLGSLLAHGLCRVRQPPPRVLFALLALTGLLVALTPAIFHRQTGGLGLLGADLGWSSYLKAVFTSIAAVILVPGIVAGSVFPYLMKTAESHMTSAGATIGRLVSVNTLAAILGSLLAGFVLLDRLGLWSSLGLVASAYLLLAVVVMPVAGRYRLAAAALTLTGVILLNGWIRDVGFQDVGLDREQDEELVDLREGAHGTVAVVRRGKDLRLKVNNSYLLGTSLSAVNLRIQSWIPLALHPNPRSVFFLGMGTGITAGGGLDFPVGRVVVTELNPDVVRASRLFFAEHLNGLFTDPRVRVVVDDGRNYLSGTRERYDVVIGDIFLTYRAGVGSLYTREHFETIRSRLAPGGLFAQWLTMFDLSRREFGIIARTFLEVFPDATLWRRGFSPRFPIFALVGGTGPLQLDDSRFAGELRRVTDSVATSRPLWLAGIPLAAYVGNLAAAEPLSGSYPVATDDLPLVEYLAPITERDHRGSGEARVLAWDELGLLSGELLELSPPVDDPVLERVQDSGRDQVLAGLAFYNYETYRRLGRETEATIALERFRRLVGEPSAEESR